MNIFFFNDTATTEIYTLSLHDALPISWYSIKLSGVLGAFGNPTSNSFNQSSTSGCRRRSEEHTSELQSHSDLVCRLLLEKKKKRVLNTLTRRFTYYSIYTQLRCRLYNA